MQPIFISRFASYAMMPLMAAGGFAGYSYYNQPYAQPYASASSSACITFTTNIVTTTYQPQIVNLQRYFVNQGYLQGTPNGYFDQPTTMALERFQADNGIPISGQIDSRTRTVIEQVTCNNGYGTYSGNPYQNPSYPYQNGSYSQLLIRGIQAPRTLAVGQIGTFGMQVAGYVPGGSALRYSVTWGDEQYSGQGASSAYGAVPVSSSGTFTHRYLYPGTYRPVFTVSDAYGHRAQTSMTVVVTGSSYGYPGCSGYSGNCYSTTYPNSYPNSYSYPSGSYPGGCTNYYDRACYVNGQYIGPDFSGMGYSTYNGPGAAYPNTAYSNSYPNTYGGPNGPDYSCYYDRACYAQMNGYSY